MMKRISALFYLLVIAAILVACTPEPPKTMPVVRYVNFMVYDPVYVGIDKGIFENNGIKVEIVGDMLAGPTAIQAVSAGEAEAGLSSIPAIINANLAGLPVIGVTDIQSALPEQPLEYYYTLCGSGIKTVEDLKGKTAAVNLWYSSFHYSLIMQLEKHGMTEKDMEYSLISFPNQMPALLAGEVDLIGLMEPYNGMAVGTYGDKLCKVFDANDVFGSKQFTLHFLNRIWAKENPELAKAWVKSIKESVAWIEANQAEAKFIIAKYTQIPAEFVPIYHFQDEAKVIEEDVAFWFDYMKARDENPEKYWMNVSSIATNEYQD